MSIHHCPPPRTHTHTTPPPNTTTTTDSALFLQVSPKVQTLSHRRLVADIGCTVERRWSDWATFGITRSTHAWQLALDMRRNHDVRPRQFGSPELEIWRLFHSQGMSPTVRLVTAVDCLYSNFGVVFDMTAYFVVAFHFLLWCCLRRILNICMSFDHNWFVLAFFEEIRVLDISKLRTIAVSDLLTLKRKSWMTKRRSQNEALGTRVSSTNEVLPVFRRSWVACAFQRFIWCDRNNMYKTEYKRNKTPLLLSSCAFLLCSIWSLPDVQASRSSKRPMQWWKGWWSRQECHQRLVACYLVDLFDGVIVCFERVFDVRFLYMHVLNLKAYVLLHNRLISPN